MFFSHLHEKETWHKGKVDYTGLPTSTSTSTGLRTAHQYQHQYRTQDCPLVLDQGSSTGGELAGRPLIHRRPIHPSPQVSRKTGGGTKQAKQQTNDKQKTKPPLSTINLVHIIQKLEPCFDHHTPHHLLQRLHSKEQKKPINLFVDFFFAPLWCLFKCSL